MSQAELKEQLIGKIVNIKNEDLLLEIYQLLEMDSNNGSVYILNNEQIAIVEESRAQIKRGEFLTGEEADKEIDEWLCK